MARRPPPPTEEEIAQAFDGPIGDRFGPVLSPTKFAELIELSPKTVYEWLSRGRLAGAARKRGKHVFIWRDRALKLLFANKEWKCTPTRKKGSPSGTASPSTPAARRRPTSPTSGPTAGTAGSP
jgi:hypothetical protein